ncbi:two component transcriptional regulator, LuxR family [Reichenbachiella faecimaris]|uniref:Two component transcriptional regulator, LuxR family n=1 Tax=Reichenbachiella faecimaris TaxID=692418 RepID=A0A1W2GQW8_REIFA|nr:response regulator transcription factor [Reichenbachiella faecimaris]SMD39075.1 two component transcriptional regulator, LuxR family [Reichenbachiella faecimaris]
MSVKILLVDDHKIMRDGIKAIITESPEYSVVAEASDGVEALDYLADHEVDIVVIDINMPNLDGVECTKAIKNKNANTKVLAMSMYVDEQHIVNMLKAGANGYISKDAGRLVLLEALDTIRKGEAYHGKEITTVIMSEFSKTKEEKMRENPLSFLTSREIDVLKLIVEERSNYEIAETLHISIRTVDAHRRNLLQKTGVKNAVGLTKFALKNGI